MTMTSTAAEATTFQALNGIPGIDIGTNFSRALAAGRHSASLLAEVIALRRGHGRLSPQNTSITSCGIRMCRWRPGLPGYSRARSPGRRTRRVPRAA
jgi:hypothetical protein